MEILGSVSVIKPHLFSKFPRRDQNSVRPQLPHCTRSTGQSRLNSTDDEREKRHNVNDIWNLFKEAQQNILYLNKQRCLAMEELERVQNEKNSLLNRLEKLEIEKQANVARDKFTISSELLLRIDSLVLHGVIGSMEASDFRRIVMDSRHSLPEDLYDISSNNDAEFLSQLKHYAKKSKKNGSHIIHICTEMSPVVSVGSLGPYITGLSCSLQRRGNLVEVILPKYACLNLDEIQGLREVEAEFNSYFNGQLHGNRIWTGVVNGIGVTFIQPIYYSSFFDHDRVYGCSNDFERFTYFSRASLDYLVKSGKRPDVIHIHNWQTSIVGPLFWDVFANQGLEGTRILLTCQSFDSQCLEQPEKLSLCGLDPYKLFRPDRLQDNKKAHLVNILKGGVVYSNKVIVASSVLSKGEIISGLGHGLEHTLAIHKEKLTISPRGFDKLVWDPSRHNLLPQSYNSSNLDGKSVCKLALQKLLDLPKGDSIILVGYIFLDISDVDLEKLKPLVRMASRRGVQFAVMGSIRSPELRRSLEIFQEEMKDGNVRFINEYDEELSHLMISGSDIMLCSSFDDTLLQVPLKAMKYGAAPISLPCSDGRFRHEADSSQFSSYVNYTFANLSLGQAIDEIVRVCIAGFCFRSNNINTQTLMKSNPLEWTRRITDAMKQDFSWDSECADVHVAAYADVKML